MMDLGSDLAFILGDVFGGTVSYTPPAGDVVTTDGTYKETMVAMTTGDGDVVGLQRTIVVATGSLPGVALDSELDYLDPRTGISTHYIVRDLGRAMGGAAQLLFVVPG